MRAKLRLGLLVMMMLILSFSHSDNILAQSNKVTRQDMLNIAKEIHPPGCTDSMTADYCPLPTAYDARAEIYELLKQGKNKDEVLSFLIDKYGERILASPARKGFNLIAWVMPGIAILVGGIVMAIFVRRWVHKKEKPAEIKENQVVSPKVEKMVQTELKNWL
jgi:cytochrome c-type biogenesis protein CcmH